MDLDRSYQLSVQDRLAGRQAEAIQTSRRILLIRPQDVDTRLNLALALIASDRLDEAQDELDLVLAQAPDYEDAVAARALIERLRRDRLNTSHPVWRLDVSAGSSALSKDLDPWRETSLTLSRRTGQGTVSATIDHAERFDRTDTYIEGRVDRRLGFASVYGAIGGTPDADFRPEIALRAGGQMSLGKTGLAATLDTWTARFNVGTITTLQPGAEYSTANGAFIIGGRWINVWDERDTFRSGYSLRALLAIRPSVRLRAGLADAPESSDGRTVDVRSTTFGIEVDVTDHFTARFNGLREDRTAYDRDEVTLGFGVRF